MKTRDEKPGTPAFVTDCTLGRLAKWMRLAGMDVLLDLSTPSPTKLKMLAMEQQRWILTRSQKVYRTLGDRSCLFIHSNHPDDQARQVIQYFGIRRFSLRPLSRCPKCNLIMTMVSKEQIVGRVPDHVWQEHDRFNTCDGCARIYWPGTHAGRIGQRIDHWFLSPSNT